MSGETMDRANSKFKRLRTVADYRELAETIITSVEIDEKEPEKSGMFEYAKCAFTSAVWLVRWSRNADVSVETEGTVVLSDGRMQCSTQPACGCTKRLMRRGIAWIFRTISCM